MATSRPPDIWNAEQRQQLGRALIIILGTILAGCFVSLIVSFLSGWNETFPVVVLLTISTLVCLILGRRGHERAATLAALQVLVFALCVNAFRGNGLHDLSMLVIPVMIVIAGLLLGQKNYILFVAATVLCVSVVGFVRWWQGRPDPASTNPSAELAIIVIVLVVTAVIGRLLAGHLLQSLRRTKENEIRYRTILENIQDVYYEMRPDGRLLEISPAGPTLFGAARDEMVGKSFLPFYADPEDHKTLLEGLRGSQHISNHSISLKDLQGQLHHVLISASLKQGSDGEETVAGSIRDVTDRRALEESLAQAQKMESIGTLTGGIAHDFNNLLTVINGHCELAVVKMQKGLDFTRDITAIRDAGKSAADLTRKLLAFSRKQAYQPSTIEVKGFLARLAPIVQTLIGEDIRIDCRTSPAAPPVLADPAQFESVLINLLANARDAINQKTERSSEKHITITADEAVLEKSGETELPPGKYLRLEVADNGIGMPPEVRSRMFDPFFTTKKSGTGLGLATVYGIVRQNGGSVTVDTAPGAGTTFRIFWPATEVRVQAGRRRSDRAARGTEAVLLVEDDPSVLRYARHALASYGYRIFEASNGAQALEVLRENADQIQLLVTDVVMPEMDGKELAQKARDRMPNLRVLFVSGYAEDRVSQKGMLESGLWYVQKPYSVDELAQKVREKLDRG